MEHEFHIFSVRNDGIYPPPPPAKCAYTLYPQSERANFYIVTCYITKFLRGHKKHWGQKQSKITLFHKKNKI